MNLVRLLRFSRHQRLSRRTPTYCRFTRAVPPRALTLKHRPVNRNRDGSVAEGPRAREPPDWSSSRSTPAPSTTPNPTATRSPTHTPCSPARTSTWSTAPPPRRPTPVEDQREMGDLRAGQQHGRPGNPVDGTHQCLLVRVTFQPGHHRRLDRQRHFLGAVPASAGQPHRWCPLTAGATCVSPDADAAALATTEAVNLYGADTDGAHPLEKP